MAPKTSITIHDFPQPPEVAIKYTYTVLIFGQRIFTTATSNPDVLTEWIDGVSKNTPNRYVGLEFEFDISTTRLSTLQLCTGDHCIVFQLDRKSPLPASLSRFLIDNNNTFACGHIKSKVEIFRTHFPFDGVVKGLELGKFTPFMIDLKRRELDSMALGEVDSKWDRLPEKLTVGQVHYACLDAFLNLHIMFGSKRNHKNRADFEAHTSKTAA